jgi:hypothetical protein
MRGKRLVISIVLAAIVVIGLIYALPGRNNPPDQQASPHAINQPG